MLTEADILEALRVCYDPALRINIVDLGRVGNINVVPDPDAPGSRPRSRVTVELLTNAPSAAEHDGSTEGGEETTSEAEQQDAMLAASVTNRLYGLPELSRAEVILTSTPAWTPDRMSPAARAERSKQRGLIQLG